MAAARRLASLTLAAVLVHSLSIAQQGMAALSADSEGAAGPIPAPLACPARVTSVLDLPNVPACRQLLTMMEDTRHGCASLKPYTDPEDPLSTCALDQISLDA